MPLPVIYLSHSLVLLQQPHVPYDEPDEPDHVEGIAHVARQVVNRLVALPLPLPFQLPSHLYICTTQSKRRDVTGRQGVNEATRLPGYKLRHDISKRSQGFNLGLITRDTS